MTNDEAVSLRSYLEERLAALDKRIDQRFVYIEKALKKESNVFDIRLTYLDTRIEALIRLVYIGLGLALASGYLVKILIDHVSK